MRQSLPTEPVRDGLTGLVGRDGARARLAAWLDEGAQVQAVLIGLRRFDAVNLAYGAQTGDAALAEIANRLKHFAADELPGGWLLSRSGGGQFLLISRDPCSRESWQLTVAQLLERLARPIGTPGGTVRISPRAALLRGLQGEDADSMLDRLGQALESLVSQPGRRLAWADGEATRVGRSAAQLEADLLRAIDADQIEVLFQPQYACADDRLIGAEALARWNHPELGRIGAGGLFAIAERTDHVPQLSRHIARLALRAAARWPGDLRLSLNVTPNDLAAGDFTASFEALLKESRFPGWRLTLEVTEQVLLSDVSGAAQAFTALSARGVRFALDDFGAGFCNFRYLKLLPLHYLKLDRSMIEGVAADPRDLAVLRAIIAMARALDLQVIAEGVENDTQRLLARAEGCSVYQGFLRSAPLFAESFLTEALG
ncbi:GGDEF domain-containing phosphodiesterase [Novosphingobium sp.]|jgi:predicted signal transduction protein with EAL and GGDEF domain|uniref:GGDEF domain-containing phosphodiesterase n=1 Tax=Novosphingobium sp. TaxID=1874826 RepID=UPI0022C4C9B4|nr:GGDEF domain-containing phosphodiesterase [Novosphingobium sp.]MCZ8017476.1 GGDEF domain-containing phosphodiesterase [Novosphingobium sp.]MCZ8034000.1 GGDEF domain-containing phosphodiesterase [Novosphingobium sp.]MCZ8051356.1 GGDEF domain-containing phosphodiesterase [Novosphingobium sp.]MCZ8059702.1 GGDEF domain-containing phosphodiesterase [Novosphingobium sp.]MCZ8231540.1 GGDEF domain-containing phosphodiesterase [Novosphingobium sp.]